MDKIPTYRVGTAKARELADLAGVKIDLENARDAMLAHMKQEDAALSRSLYVAALILYRRCFKNAVRHPIRNEHLIQVNGSLEYHQHWMNLADKYAAHSVNAFEDVAVGVMVQNDKVIGVQTLGMHRVGEGEQAISDFATYINRILVQIVLPHGQVLLEEVQKEAETLPITQIMRAERLRLTAPDNDQVGLPRNSRQQAD